MAFGLKDESLNWYGFRDFQMYSSVRNVLHSSQTAVSMHLTFLLTGLEAAMYTVQSKMMKIK
jgi:hypothetical protein